MVDRRPRKQRSHWNATVWLLTRMIRRLNEWIVTCLMWAVGWIRLFLLILSMVLLPLSCSHLLLFVLPPTNLSKGSKGSAGAGCSAWSSCVSRSPPLAKIGSNHFPLFFSPHVFPLRFHWTATKSSTIGQGRINWPVVRQCFLLFVFNPGPIHSNWLRFWRILLLRVPSFVQCVQ
jgi:hypothetical protein